MSSPSAHRLIIIGSGPAGLTAAIYAGRGSLAPLVLAGPEPGGQLTLTTDVEDFPGFPDGVQGPELTERMRRQAERFGASIVSAVVSAVDFSRRPFSVTAGEQTYEAECVIIATGASARWLGLPSEQRLLGHGVSSCAVCDGYFFRGRDVAVVGGGDSAAKEALHLAKLAKSVTLIHRRDTLRTQQILVDRLRALSNVTFRMEREVVEVLGGEVVSGLRLRSTVTSEEETLPVAGLFVAIGHTPNTAPFKPYITCDSAGYIVSHDGATTNIPGIFVAGDVHDKRYRQAVTAAGAGCRAAMEAEEYLESPTVA